MKKLHLLIFITFFSQYLFSQSTIYHPFPDSGALWSTADLILPGCLVPPCDYTFIQVGNDTIISGQHYRKLLEGSIYFGIFDTGYSPVIFSGSLLRDDTLNRKVYLGDVSGTPDHILYDFNLQIGDTLPDGPVSSKVAGVYVTAIDSVLLQDNTYRRRLKLNSIFYGLGIDSLCLIEGIGYTGGFLRPILPIVGQDGSFHLACFSEDGITRYNYALLGSAYCELPNGVHDLHEQTIQILPVPVAADNYLYIEGLNSGGSVSVYDLLGRLVLNKTLKFPDNKIFLSSSDFSPSTYICKISAERNNAFLVRKIIVQ